jgi:stress responsive alpha/beta barrel protein
MNFSQTETKIFFAATRTTATICVMFSHIVVFWTDPANPNAADELITGANEYLKSLPNVLHFHAGKMVPSHRPVVDQTYQVALNLVFSNKQAQDDYQVHPRHIEFVEKVFKHVCKKAVIYDFE